MSPRSEENLSCRDSLVLYKHDPARVVSVERKRLIIALPDGETLRVRPKDVDLLHPGPLEGLDDLGSQEGEMRTAWELLSGGTTTLPELAELAYGEYTPATAWAAWQWVYDSLYFEGTPQEIVVRTPAQVAQERSDRQARAAERRAWEAFLQRARGGEYTPEEDERYLLDTERLALGQTDHSRVLSELGRGETQENAHALLLELGYWDHTVVPYPERLGLATAPPQIALPNLPAESRADLTSLPALAIDDEGSTDPDDAISLETTGRGRRLWVHVADAAALVAPDSLVDLEARARGATLYLPSGKVPMLPPKAAQQLGMGLQEVSPALSFGLDLDAEGQVIAMQLVRSLVRVTRVTYEEAEAQLHEEPLSQLYRIAQRFQARRRANGAVRINLPEVRVRVTESEVIIQPLLPLRSRALVREAMLMAGEATAGFALDEGIALPYTTQDPPDTDERPDDLAGMFALRRHMSRSEYSIRPGPHAGLGLERYVQATSPLRRYLDLVVHQQLRAHLRGEGPLEAQDLIERIGAAEALAGTVSYAERLAIEHWTLVYLLQHPDWRGEGILVERWDRRGKMLIPELGLEPQIHLRQDWSLNDPVPVKLVDVDLPTLEAYFRADPTRS
ncbi:MAG: RNB domain-containing ribonuclease [Anaerolineae bacterium]|jgi:exoribonuclease-2